MRMPAPPTEMSVAVMKCSQCSINHTQNVRQHERKHKPITRCLRWCDETRSCVGGGVWGKCPSQSQCETERDRMKQMAPKSPGGAGGGHVLWRGHKAGGNSLWKMKQIYRWDSYEPHRQTNHARLGIAGGEYLELSRNRQKGRRKDRRT